MEGKIIKRKLEINAILVKLIFMTAHDTLGTIICALHILIHLILEVTLHRVVTDPFSDEETEDQRLSNPLVLGSKVHALSSSIRVILLKRK